MIRRCSILIILIIRNRNSAESLSPIPTVFSVAPWLGSERKNAPVPKNRGIDVRYRDLPEYPGTYTLCGGWRRSRGTLLHPRPLL